MAFLSRISDARNGSSLMTYLVDTNILIYHLNGCDIATEFLDRHQESCAISCISFIEVLSYDYSEDDARKVEEFLRSFPILAIHDNAMLSAVKIRRKRKIKTPDAIIAGTAQSSDLVVVTRNVSDFKNMGLIIHNPYDESSS